MWETAVRFHGETEYLCPLEPTVTLSILNKNAFQWDVYRLLVDHIPGGEGVYPSMHWAWGVCIQACTGRGCLPRVGGMWQTPPPVDRQTPVKNYLCKLRLRRVKICFRSFKWVSRSSKYLYSVAGLFTCRDGFAIPYDYVCNGIGDCGDGSDEDPQFAGCQGNWTVFFLCKWDLVRCIFHNFPIFTAVTFKL